MRRLLAMGVILLSTVSTAHAQLPPGLPITPEQFAVTHFWGSPSVISTRHQSMGGAYVADSRSDWHGNPAGLVALKQPGLVITHNISRFALLPTFRATLVGLAYPLGKKADSAIKITSTSVRSSGPIKSTPAPLRLKAEEDDIGLELGHRVNRRLSVGAATVHLSTNSQYDIAGVGMVTELRSWPTTFGGRIGAIWDLGEKVSVGTTYDNYMETVRRTAPPLQLPTRSFRFHSTGYRAGAAVRPDGDTTILLDYEALRLVGNQTEVTRRNWTAGVERRIGSLLLRAGTFDGKLTGGIGLERGSTNVSYGFTGRYDKSLPGQGARTAHTLEAVISF